MLTKVSNTSLMFIMNHGGHKMLLMGSTATHRNFHITGIPPLCEQCGSIGQTKRYNGVVGVLGTGVPRLACLRPTAWLSQQAVRPIFINWSLWSVVGPIVLPHLWFEYGLSSNQIRTNDVRNVVLLAVIPRAYTITSFGSDQCYVLVHIIMEFHLYGHPDDLLLSPSATFYLLHDHVEHPSSVGNFCKHYLRVPFMRYMFGWKKWLSLIHVHLV